MATSSKRERKTRASSSNKKSSSAIHALGKKLTDALSVDKKTLKKGQQAAMEHAEELLVKLEKEVKAKPRHSMLIAFLVGIIVGRVILK